MSVDLINHNIPVLRQAAEQFRIGDVAGGESSFAMVHHDVKEGIYHTMWQMNGSPNIPKFGTNRFNDSNGLFSTSIEKAQVIDQYFQSKGITAIPSDRLLREPVNSFRHPLDIVVRFGKGANRLTRDCENCTPAERTTVLVVLGGGIIGCAALTAISLSISNALKYLVR